MRVDPGGWIGILGGGQLGRMMVLAAKPMGYRCVVLDPTPDCPAGQVADRQIVAPYDDLEAVRELARVADVVTYEFENIALGSVKEVSRSTPVFPNAGLLEVSQNRLREKRTCERLGLSTARFRPISSMVDLSEGLAALGTPAVLKTAEGGYDGKGQSVIQSLRDAEPAWNALGGASHELILEEWIPFDCEVSVVVARTQDGQILPFPIGENVHRQGILHTTTVPARIAPACMNEAVAAATTLAHALDLVGVMAVEFFVVGDRVLVNEMAPRPHNSGHYTIEACQTSQFEQHIRAVCGLPPGDPSLLSPAAMVNLLGDDWETAAGAPHVEAALAVPGSHLHLYGKEEARPGRKMGHITVLAEAPTVANDKALEAWRAFSGRDARD